MSNCLFSLGVLALASTHTIATEPPHYRVEPLGSLPGTYATQVVRINDAETIIGQARGPQLEVRSWVWTRESGMVELLPPPGYTDIRVEGLSENGIICGSIRPTFTSPPHAFRYQGGEFVIVTPPPSSGGIEAYSVNNSGEMVGFLIVQSAGQLGGEFYYSDATGVLDIAPGEGSAWDINNAGFVVGMTGSLQGYRWSLATGLELLPWPAGWDGSEGLRINQQGHVAGRVIDERPGRDPCDSALWRGGAPEIISGSGFHQSRPLGINDRDEVIGADGTESTPLYTPHLWLPGKGRFDFTLVQTTPPLTQIMIAHDINNRGQIIGRAYSPEIGDAAVLYTPIGWGCGSSDFNGDGDSGTDQDIEAFFACIGGTCCATCFPGGADFNGDGDAGTDQDIEAFFRVLGGNAC
ncbi:MAG TPA: hypothetical protein VD997_12115 [Phycisphaerales bacterium]|nr:hypothetical protein [Phycisphaerales bacterium]